MTTKRVRSEEPAEYEAVPHPEIPKRIKERAEDAILEQAARILQNRLQHRETVFSSPESVRHFLQIKLRPYPYEVFCALFLDNRHRLIEFVELFRGTIDGASVHPREVIRECIRVNAAAVIFTHNHPSGVEDPSQSDLRITQRLKDALAFIDVRVLDHIIIGEGDGTSLAERGLL
jgi:DNA repair protein RadC